MPIPDTMKSTYEGDDVISSRSPTSDGDIEMNTSAPTSTLNDNDKTTVPALTSLNHTDNTTESLMSPLISQRSSVVSKYKEEMTKRRAHTSKTKNCSRFCVDTLEQIYLPRCFGRGNSNRSDEMSNVGSSGGFGNKDGRIPLVRGLGLVVNGTHPASESVILCGLKPLRYFWYMISGMICDIIQFCIDMVLFKLVHIDSPSICWALGFSISIIFRHTSHRYLVFGNYVGGYWNSLLRMYGGYSIIIVLSTIFNFVMTTMLHIPHYLAWIVTLLWTGVVNYFILKHLWSFGGNKATTPSVGKQSAVVGSGVNVSVAMSGEEVSPTSNKKVRRTISRP